jgi:hypothetical protein
VLAIVTVAVAGLPGPKPPSAAWNSAVQFVCTLFELPGPAESQEVVVEPRVTIVVNVSVPVAADEPVLVWSPLSRAYVPVTPQVRKPIAETAARSVLSRPSAVRLRLTGRRATSGRRAT